ncbi:MAG: peptide ABC transporter substrate-binding protein [Treponema sp.]|nr:peptide ABC transporter substrate-binding protein [Treponema sp.]
MYKKIISILFLSIFFGNYFLFAQFDKNLQRNLNMICADFEYNMNPHTSNYSSEAQLMNALYEGLFSYHPETLQPVDAIAENYKVSRNKLTWTFTLRSDAKFSDGSKITSNNILESWTKLLMPSTNAPFASLLDCIVGAEEFRTGKKDKSILGISTPNENTLVLRLKKPTKHLPKILCHHAFSVVSTKENVYSGAFKLESQTKTGFELKKNEHYWDEKNVALPGISIMLSSDKEENVFLLNAGKVDWIDGTANIEQIIDKSTITIGTQFGTEYLFFKAQNQPWTNENARNALLYALNWNELRSGSLVPAGTLLVPLFGYPDVAEIGDTDIEYAKTLLENAKKELNLTNKDITLTFAISENEYMRKQAKVLQEACELLNINFMIQKTPINRYLDSISGWNADIFTYTWIGDFPDPMAFLELFRGGSTLNESKWDSTTFDNLIKEAEEITDEAKRYEKLAEAEEELLNKGVIIPISHPVSLNFVDYSVLDGWYNNSLDIHPFKYMFFKESEQNLIIVKNEFL